MDSKSKESQFIHFGAGPGCLPDLVKMQLAAALDPPSSSSSSFLDREPFASDASLILPIWHPRAHHSIYTPGDTLPDTLSIAELSHRTDRFDAIMDDTKEMIRKIMHIPDDYDVLFLQGGASLQFSQFIYNLLPDLRGGEAHVADYFVTGVWSEKAYEDALKLGIRVNKVLGDDHSYDSTRQNQFYQEEGMARIVDPKDWRFSPHAKYIYFCDNETIQGISLDLFQASVPKDKVIICDSSSSILTRPMDVPQYSVIFASTQKNLGIAGATLVILKKSLFSTLHPHLPAMLDYAVHIKARSIHNTPPVVAIYSINLILRWTIATFGLNILDLCKWHADLADRIYSIIDGSNGFYFNPVHPKDRSVVNIVFRITKEGVPDAERESRFLKETAQNGMIELRGHRAVGGVRLSLYNAIPERGVRLLAGFMREFCSRNTAS